MKSIGSLVEGVYVLEERIRVSRETLVFRAANRLNNAPAVVKFFSMNDHRHAKAFYEAEIEFYKACVGIAGIPAMLSTGEEDQQKYIVTDFLGCSLAEVTASGKMLTEASLQLLARSLLVIIQAIHERGFLYLNLAPENILIDLQTSRVCLIDFKYSVCYSEMLTSGIDPPPAKNLFFESGDRLLGRTPGYRSDIESLAYLLMFLENGSLPWKAASRNEADSVSTPIHYRRRLSRTDYFRGLSEQLRRLWTIATTIDIEEKPDFEQLKGIFQKLTDKITFEDSHGRKATFSHNFQRGLSLEADGKSGELHPKRESDILNLSVELESLPASYNEDSSRGENRKRTAQKEGPELTPSLRSLIRQIREERDYC